ncbi:MAG TPA: hypothetical protein VFA04_15945 [Bryobacteraceae bacterium]|nr:hypothetical protein [Bryobacteraceae bacterium]
MARERRRFTPVWSAPHKRHRALRTTGPLPIVVLLVVLGVLAFVYWRYRHSASPTTATTPVVRTAPR